MFSVRVLNVFSFGTQRALMGLLHTDSHPRVQKSDFTELRDRNFHFQIIFSSNELLLTRMSSRVSCFRHFLKTSCDLIFCRLDIPKCPLDGEEILRDQYFRDRCCEREVHNLQCFCRYRDRGCDWKGELGYLKVVLQQSRWRICFIQGTQLLFSVK